VYSSDQEIKGYQRNNNELPSAWEKTAEIQKLATKIIITKFSRGCLALGSLA
jgi:hypothetical protein